MHDFDPSSLPALFDAHGVRCTRQREEVYLALASSHTHPTADELFNQVRRAQPGISLATVYNALEIFTTHGLCRKLAGSSSPDGSGPACRYDADLSDHIHVVTADGRLHDVPDTLGREVLSRVPDDLIRQVESVMGLRIDRLSINFIAAQNAHPDADAG